MIFAPTLPVTFYVWINHGVKCYRTFPCRHLHVRPQGFIVDHACYCGMVHPWH